MKTRFVAVVALVLVMIGVSLVQVPSTAQAQAAIPKGPWADRIVWSEQPNSGVGLAQLKAGEADFFLFSLQSGAEKTDAFLSPNVQTTSTFGSLNALLFNPNRQTGDDVAGQQPMNPYTDPQIRQAMHWIIDRNFLNLEALDGYAVSYVTPFNPKDQDYFREIELFQELEAEYSANFARGNAQIAARMTALGATRNTGTCSSAPANLAFCWKDQYGDTINLQVLQRTEDERLEIGRYVSAQLRRTGLLATDVPIPASQVSPLVYGGSPNIGNWHIYTEGWLATATVAWRDGQLFSFNSCGLGIEPFCSPRGTYTIPADFQAAAEKLAFGRYQSLNERQQLIRDLVPRTFTETNHRMWLQAEEAVFPASSRVDGAVYDAFGGPTSEFTLKSAKLVPGAPGVNRETGAGGDIRALNFQMFVDAWNPWESPGFLYDSIQRRALGDQGMWLHPETGLWMEERVNVTQTTAGPTGTMPVPNSAVYYQATRVNLAPVPMFTVLVNATNTSIRVDASTAADPDHGNITAYAWDFGDGAAATTKTAWHTYAAPGQYSVRLTVTDGLNRVRLIDEGAWPRPHPIVSDGTATKGSARQISVGATQPMAAFTQTTNVPIRSTDVTFRGGTSVASSGRTIASYSWNLGDGTTATTVDVTHRYAAAGDYSVTLTVTDSAGETGTISREFRVTAAGRVLTDQRWLAVPAGTRAVSRITTTLVNPGKWHTGQDITLDDVVYALSAAFRRGFGDVFDHDPLAATPGVRTDLSTTIKGFEFNLAQGTVTAYTDFWHVDEREIAGDGFVYMASAQAPVPWEITEAILQSVLNDKTAIQEGTAAARGLPRLDLTKNPLSLSAIDEAFAAVRAENNGAGRIPALAASIPGVGTIITQGEATARYQAAQAFRNTYRHYYASNGPFILQSVNPVFRQTVMIAFRDGYPFTADHWDFLKVKRAPTASFGTFPATMLAGTASTLTVTTQVGAERVDAKAVRWFVRQLATGGIPIRGDAVRTGVGTYDVQLLSTSTVGLQTGAYELVVVIQGDQGARTQSFGFTVTSQIDFFSALFSEVEDRLDTQGQQLTDLTDNVGTVQTSATGLQTLVTAVLALAVVAIVVPAAMLAVILRRLPTKSGPPAGEGRPPEEL